MLKTPLNAFHRSHSAQLVDFAGWEMPMLYTSIHDEHRQVRTSGGLFDVSHMGRVRFTGRHARRLLERVCTRRISDMQAGQCRYSLVCNERGGVRDDVIVYRMDEDEFLVVVNGANREKMVGHFEAVRAAGDLAARIEDETLDTAMVAIQGPKVMQLVATLSKEVPTLKRYRFTVKNLVVVKLVISRTGYTGEDGIEVILPGRMSDMAMKLLLQNVDMKSADAIVKPAGLGARDTLRIEAGMPLYGHELGEDIPAMQCGVDFAIALDKEGGDGFIGQDAIKTAPARKKLVGLAIEGKRAARQGASVKRGDRTVGVVSSGCVSPTLGTSIAMAFVDGDSAEAGTALQIDLGRATAEARVAPLPFYKAPKPS